MCDLCIEDQIKKYGSQTIKCKGLASAEKMAGPDLYKEMTKDITEEEKLLLDCSIDPYLFMDTMVDRENIGKEHRSFHRRWYQEGLVRCLTGDTLITLKDNSFKKIKDIEINDEVLSFNLDTNLIEPNLVTQTWFSGYKTVCELHIDTNDYLTLTEDHPVLVLEDNLLVYKSIEGGLSKSDVVVIYRDNKVSYHKIKCIKDKGIEKTYDIEVANNHNFVANNIIVHNCTAQSKVVRMGRRCLPDYTKILLEDYSEKYLKDLKIGDKVLSKRGQNLVPNNVINIWDNGFQPIFKIALTNGKTIDLTSNHPLLVILESDKEQWKSIDDGLKIGDIIYNMEDNVLTLSSIKSIKYLREEKTFDIEIGRDHNFIANGIVSHNTGKTSSLAMIVIHKMLVKEKFRVLLVSPYAVQTEEVVETIKSMCAALPENPIASAKGSPVHKVTFKNGSILMGFTAATNGDQIRGQPGDLIVLDEVDDIPEKAITSIMGIKMQNPDVEIWRSGTPKGELNLHRAEQDQLTKSFHYPSYVNPNYTDDMDLSLRADYGDGIGYVQEVLALTGLSSASVFQTLFVSRASQRQTFLTAGQVLLNRSNYICVMGVDWNHDKVGTRIIIVAYDKINPQFSIIEKEQVALEGYTQQLAMDKIIKLNQKYNLDHIFVDQGFGATQIGSLKLYAESQRGIVPKGHPDLKLLDLQAVDYGSSTEFQDPVSGKIYTQPTKQVAVQNTVLILERDMLSLDPKEDKDIILQLKNYIEKSRNKNRITYGYVSKKIGDHDLDALMIALYGYRLLYSTLFVGAAIQGMIRYSEKQTEDSLPQENTSLETLGYVKFAPKVVETRSRISNFSSRSSNLRATRQRRMF